MQVFQSCPRSRTALAFRGNFCVEYKKSAGAIPRGCRELRYIYLTGQAGSPALYPLRMSDGMKAVRVASRNEKRGEESHLPAS
jgi:hypothetical protein